MWAEIAAIDSEYNIHSSLISMCFRRGFRNQKNTQTTLAETLRTLNEKIAQQKIEQLELMVTLLNELNRGEIEGDKYVYVTDETLIPEYIRKTTPISSNPFFVSLEIDTEKRAKDILITNYMRINSMQIILKNRKIPAHTQHTVFALKYYTDLTRHEKTFINNHIGDFPALTRILQIKDFSTLIQIKATRIQPAEGESRNPDNGEIQFQFDARLESIIREFLSHSRDILDSLYPLTKNH
jgi:hypothetical protein